MSAMNHNEVVTALCSIMGLAYHSIGDYSRASDGVCATCAAIGFSFENRGHIVDYVRAAVVEKLARDGHTIASGFNSDGTEKGA